MEMWDVCLSPSLGRLLGGAGDTHSGLGLGVEKLRGRHC